MRSSFLILLASLPVAGLYAQDSLKTRHLPQVEVLSERNSAAMAGAKSLSIDSATLCTYQQSSLAELLGQQSPVFVKSYGPAGTATSSFRGAGAAHTLVLLNGFSMQNPATGQPDLSLVPVAFLDDVSIQYGGDATRYGSGAMGGVILLNNRPAFGQGLSFKAGLGTGSFGAYSQQYSISQSAAKYVFSLKTFQEGARNDFSYADDTKAGHPVVKEPNDQSLQRGFLLENYFKISERQRANARLWYQYADREIPPTLQETESQATQQDQSWRASTEWAYMGNAVSYTARGSYINEYIHYKDPLHTIYSNSLSQSAIAEAEARFLPNIHNTFTSGLNETYSQAWITDISNIPDRNSTALFATYVWTPGLGKLKTQVSTRQEILNSRLIPFTPAAGIEWSPISYMTLKASANRVYRTPGFDDLYWMDGFAKGNPKLTPESGWNKEAGIIGRLNLQRLSLSAEFTGFDREINDWILWHPNSSGIWTVDNVMKVHSQGLELQLKSDLKISNRLLMRLSGLGNYISSISEQSHSANDASVGKQLIYVPIYTAQANAGIIYRRLYFNANYTYTGYRYTSTDNYEYLAPYRTFNMQLSYGIKAGKYGISFNAQVNNIGSEVYQSIAQRPMPLINYKAGITLTFNK